MKHPTKTPATSLVPDKSNLFFQSACPFRARSLIRQLERVSKFMPGGSAGIPFQMLLNAGSEFDVAHDGWPNDPTLLLGVWPVPIHATIWRSGQQVALTKLTFPVTCLVELNHLVRPVSRNDKSFEIGCRCSIRSVGLFCGIARRARTLAHDRIAEPPGSARKHPVPLHR